MEKPGVGIGVIVIRGDKVLLGKRKSSHGAGKWQFPGGHLEMFEQFSDCAKREVLEETGLKVEIVNNNPVFVTNDFFPSDDKHYVTLFMLAKWITGEPKVLEPEKCGEWVWFSWKDLAKREDLMIGIDNLIKQGYNPFRAK